MLRQLCLGVGIAVICSFPCLAASRFWIDSAGGLFTDTGNWSATEGGAGGASVPVSGDLVQHRVSGTYTVSYPGRGIVDPPLTYAMGIVLADRGSVTWADSGGLNKVPATVSTTQLVLTRAGLSNSEVFTTTLADFRTVSASVATNSTANNTFNVNGGTFTIAGGTGSLSVATGPDATGVLNVNNGADVVVGGTDPLVEVGKSASTTTQGTINVSGSGSTLVVNNDGRIVLGDYSTTTEAGPAGTGTLNVTSGGSVSTKSVLVANSPGATGYLNVSGAGSTLTATGALEVGEYATGVFNVTSGGVVTSTLGTIGNIGHGTATVDGAGSAWNATNLFVGYNDVGVLNITSQAHVTSTQLKLALSTTSSSGTVVVDGPGSQCNISSVLDVGSGGQGTLTVRNGASLTSVDAYLGHFANAAGTVTVDGLGAVANWNNTGILTIGAAHQGTLNVTHAGTVTSQSATLASDAGSTGVATIDGIGSTWNCNGLLTIGLSGAATLNVIGGGHLTSSTAVVGQNAAGTGIINIDGSTSEWSISGDLVLNASGTGTSRLSLSNAGKLSATGAVNVGSHGEVKGRGTIAANLNNNGVVAPGASAGTLHLNGNYTQTAAGILAIELGGTTPDTLYDQLQVAGAVSLNGTLQATLINGFVPAAGNAFDILDGAISGTFSTLSLPTLGTGLVWNLSNLYTTGVLSVGLEGDYNNNGVVDAADYVLWRKGGPLVNEVDAPGTVNAADYTAWRARFGNPGGSGVGTSSANATVPEPTTMALLVIGMLATCARRTTVS